MNKELLIYSFKILPFNILFRKFKRKLFNKFNLSNRLINFDFNKINSNNFDINFGVNSEVDFNYLPQKINIFEIIHNHYLDNSPELANQNIKSKHQNIINNFMDNKITIFDNIYDLNQFQNPNTKELDFYSIFNFDFINNHRWEQKENHKIKGNEGYDIKVPWEVGRLQFLSYIATIIIIDKKLNKQTNKEDFSLISEKIVDFIIGFIENNPNSKLNESSVQWLSAMDVSIRLSNIIYVISSLKNSAYKISTTQINKINNSILEHIKFVFKHLEWSDGMRANHYYSNITGLFLAFNYLVPKDDIIKQDYLSLKKFLTVQIINETNYQFNEDGSNFEDSLPYHTLGFEFLLFNLIIINSLTNEEITQINNSSIIDNQIVKNNFKLNNDIFTNFYHKLKSIYEFTNSISNNGFISQIGDNDSGTFINFDILNNSNAFNYKSLNYNSLDITNRIIIFEQLLNIFEQNVGYSHKSAQNNLSQNNLSKNNLTIEVNNENQNNQNNQFIKNYEDFGIVINKNKELYFTLKYSKLGQLGKGGHSHNDCLSFVLSLYGEEIFTDAGTYSYTKSYKLRNKYRSNQNHNVLTFNDFEQNPLFDRNLDDMFWIYSDSYSKNQNTSKIISHNQNLIIAEQNHKNYKYKRAFLFNDKNINCKEEINIVGNTKVNFMLAPNIKITEIKENYIIFEKKLLDNNSNNNSNQRYKIIVKLSIDIENEDNTSNLLIDDYEYSASYLNKTPAKKIIISTNKNLVNWELNWKLAQL